VLIQKESHHRRRCFFVQIQFRYIKRKYREYISMRFVSLRRAGAAKPGASKVSYALDAAFGCQTFLQIARIGLKFMNVGRDAF